MADALSGQPIAAGWLTNGVKYVGYNIAALPVILFCVKHMTSRRDAFTAGALAGPLAMLAAALFFFPMVAAYPSILDAAVPADYLLQSLTLPGLKMVFYIVVFGTFVETDGRRIGDQFL